MALFQQSQKAVSAVCQEIADTVGASADSEMTTRAGKSLNAAIEHFNTRAKWDFLRTEASPIVVFAPFQVTGVFLSAGVGSASCGAGHGIQPYDVIQSNYFPVASRVTATAASGFGFVTASGVATTAQDAPTFYRDMYALPSDWKAPYTVRLQLSNRPLNYVGRRLYDRSVVNEINNTTTFWYDLSRVGETGFIRLLAPPIYNDIMQVRYYRRMTVWGATATASPLDITQDYEVYLVSYAKWHFLVDKGEGRLKQGETWMALATEGLKMMLSDQANIPDEGLMFLPGAAQPGQLGDNTTRWLPFDY